MVKLPWQEDLVQPHLVGWFLFHPPAALLSRCSWPNGQLLAAVDRQHFPAPSLQMGRRSRPEAMDFVPPVMRDTLLAAVWHHAPPACPAARTVRSALGR